MSAQEAVPLFLPPITTAHHLVDLELRGGRPTKATKRAAPPRTYDLTFCRGQPINHDLRLATVLCVGPGAPSSFEVIGQDGALTCSIVGRPLLEARLRSALAARSGAVHVSPDRLAPLSRCVQRGDLHLTSIDVDLGAPRWWSFAGPDGKDGPNLGGLLRVLAGLPVGIAGFLQVLIVRARADWTSWIHTTRVMSMYQPPEGWPMSRRDVDDKLAAPRAFFAAALRIGLFCPTDSDINNLAPKLAAALHAGLGTGVPVKFVVNRVDTRSDPDTRNRTLLAILSRQTFRPGVLWSAHEAACFFGLPDDTQALGLPIEWAQRPFPAPPSAEYQRTDGELLLGTNSDGPRSMKVGWRLSSRLRHMLVVGRSGKGKSTLLVHLILQDIREGRGVMVLDPNADLVLEDLLPHIPPERLDDVVFLDASAWATAPFALNLFHVPPGSTPRSAAEDVVGFFETATSYVGDQMREVLVHIALAMTLDTSPRAPLDAYRLLVDEDFRNQLVARLPDERERAWWTTAFPGVARASVTATRKLFSQFETLEALEAIFGAGHQSVDFGEAIAKQRIILCSLPRGRLGAISCQLIGSFLVSQLLRAVLAREAVARQQRTPYFLYVDEAQHFATRSFATILSEARKFGLGAVLATQHLSKLSEDVRNAVMGNAGSLVTFQPGRDDVRPLLRDMDGATAADLNALPVGRALVRSDESPVAFAVDVPPPEPSVDMNPVVVEQLHARSAYKRPVPPAEKELDAPDGEDERGEQEIDFIL